MKFLIGTFFVLMLSFSVTNAQIVQSDLKTSPLHSTTNATIASQNNYWNINLRTSVNKPHAIGNIQQVKERNRLKRHTILNNPTSFSSNKTLGATPTIGKSFKGNDLTSLTPADNTIAISDSGAIVSLNNYSFSVYDTSGTAIVPPMTWNAFLGADSVALIRGKFDPRVLFDPHHQRFILCILHAPADTTHTSNIVAFSQSHDPSQGWNIYNIPGNPLQNGAWTDYPSMGINEYELFINANLFEGAPNYFFKGTYIQQIDLDSAYAGGALQYKTWTGFDINKDITLNPAPDGQMKATGHRFMNFVMMNPSEDSVLNHYIITDTMNAPTVAVVDTQYSIPAYSACADGLMKDTSTNTFDTLSTGSCWIHNAFLVDSQIHFTFSADVNGYCGVHYGRLDLATQSASYVSYAETGTNLAFPAIASIGLDDNDKNTAMVYLRQDTSIFPEVCVITIDDNMSWSTPQTVKTGETVVNILPLPYTERWGDYSGIARLYSSAKPEAWLYGCYAANTPASPTHPMRNNSYGNWIAQIKSNDFPVAVSNTKKEQDITLYPNPVRNIYYLSFELAKSSYVHVGLYDMNGRKIKELFKGELPASKNELSFDRKALANGQYFLQVRVDGEVQTKKLIVVE